MTIELDHLFILTDAPADSAGLVAALGLIEGASNSHPGQGTSNRRFFLANTTLEFLYLHDTDEAANGPAKGLRFVERSSVAGASPFGLIMRGVQGDDAIPFEGWKYYPDYFAEDQCFHVGENSDTFEEPLCICMPDNFPQRKNMPAPENPDWVLTELSLSVAVPEASTVLQEVGNCNLINLELDQAQCLELTFNAAVAGHRQDFRPQLPLVFNW